MKPRNRSDRARGLLLLVAGTIVLAIMDAIVKQLSSAAGTVQIVWGRYFVQAILLFMIIAPHRSVARLRTRRLPLQLLRVGLLLTTTFSFFAALRVMSLAETNTLFFSNPLLILLFSALLLGEPVGARRWAAVAVGFVGVVLVIQPGSTRFGWTALLPLLAAASSALYHVTTPMLARTEDPVSSLYFTALVAGIGLCAVVPFFWTPLDAAGWLGIAVLGVLGTVGHFFLIRAFETAPASTLSPFMYLYLVWATILGWLVFSDIPGLATVAGALVIFGSGLYVYRQPVPAGWRPATRPAE
jgi:drug/metabolite transporter (DMT)-like permease